MPAQTLPLPTARGTPARRRCEGCWRRTASRAARRRRRSCRFQIRLERVDRDLQRGIGILAPQFAAVEQYGVEPLRIVALAERGGVGKDVAAADRLDDADFFTRIAR